MKKVTNRISQRGEGDPATLGTERPQGGDENPKTCTTHIRQPGTIKDDSLAFHGEQRLYTVFEQRAGRDIETPSKMKDRNLSQE